MCDCNEPVDFRGDLPLIKSITFIDAPIAEFSASVDMIDISDIKSIGADGKTYYKLNPELFDEIGKKDTEMPIMKFRWPVR